MKIIIVVLLSCVLLEARGYPYPYYNYYGNMDTLAYGGSDSSRGGVALSRYYNPFYTSQLGRGMAAFMYGQPETSQPQVQPSQYYLPPKSQTTPASYLPPQQENEVAYPQIPEKSVTEVPELVDPTARTDVAPITTTLRTTGAPELVDDVEEIEERPRKRVSKKKQVKPPVEDEEDEEAPKMPAAFFPMFFGYGRNGGGNTPGGATAIANAYSTGRGGVATSHATAYGMPTPDFRNFHKNDYRRQ